MLFHEVVEKIGKICKEERKLSDGIKLSIQQILVYYLHLVFVSALKIVFLGNKKLLRLSLLCLPA